MSAGVDRPPGSGPTIVYVSKLPPTSSGIGLYAQEFVHVLSLFGPVRPIIAPPDPQRSQALRSALRGFVSGWFTQPGDFVHVELSGRALFEFYLALGRLTRHRGAGLAVTCHDVPSVAGSVMLFSLLDRRGLRRVGELLSLSIGRRWERRLLGACTAVFALTEEGAAALSRRAGRSVTALPHVVGARPARAKSPVVFVPGYVSDIAGILDVAAVVDDVRRSSSTPWTVVVGACPPGVEEQVRSRLADGTHDVVRFTGLLEEAALLETFDEAAVVVRTSSSAPAANYLAASGPLCWAVASGCLVLTDDDRAGARELEAWGLLTRSPDLAGTLRATLDEAAGSVTPVYAIAAEARRRMGVGAVARCYAEAVDMTPTARGSFPHDDRRRDPPQ